MKDLVREVGLWLLLGLAGGFVGWVVWEQVIEPKPVWNGCGYMPF